MNKSSPAKVPHFVNQEESGHFELKLQLQAESLEELEEMLRAVADLVSDPSRMAGLEMVRKH